MVTAQQEADYYKSLEKESKLLGLKDSDYKIVAERFRSNAERWQETADKIKTK